MEPKFNIGPVLVCGICCIWPIAFHLIVTRWPGWLGWLLRDKSGNKRIRIGSK